MTQWADYSGGRPSGAALKAAGFGGVIRYVGLGSSGKRLGVGEYADLTAAGVQVLLVAESGTADAWGTSTDDDRARGKANATAALNDARAKGVPDSVGIAAAADAHALSQIQISDAVLYTRGFEDILGHARTGFYGFSETLNAVHTAGLASWYWVCGSEPSAAVKTWVHFWQRNAAPTTRVVSGIQCDINEQYNQVGSAPATNPTPTVTDEEYYMDPKTYGPVPVTKDATGKDVQVLTDAIQWDGSAATLNVIALDTDKPVYISVPLYWGPNGGTGQVTPTNAALPSAGPGSWRVDPNLPAAFNVPANTTRIVVSISSNGRTGVQVVRK